MGSGEGDARVEGGVEEVGGEVHELVEERADHHHRAHHRHVGGVDGVDRDRAEPGDAEEALEEQVKRWGMESDT